MLTLMLLNYLKCFLQHYKLVINKYFINSIIKFKLNNNMYILSHKPLSGKHEEKMFEVKSALNIELYQISLKKSLNSYVL